MERPDSSTEPPVAPRDRVRTFPTTAGVYLMKDAQGRVIYVGKALNLRNRAGSYFSKAAEVDRRTADLIPEIADIDFVEAENSTGFHAPQEAARILGESINFARQGQLVLLGRKPSPAFVAQKSAVPLK